MGQTLHVVTALMGCRCNSLTEKSAAISVSTVSRFLTSFAFQISALGMRNLRKKLQKVTVILHCDLSKTLCDTAVIMMIKLQHCGHAINKNNAE